MTAEFLRRGKATIDAFGRTGRLFCPAGNTHEGGLTSYRIGHTAQLIVKAVSSQSPVDFDQPALRASVAKVFQDFAADGLPEKFQRLFNKLASQENVFFSDKMCNLLFFGELRSETEPQEMMPKHVRINHEAADNVAQQNLTAVALESNNLVKTISLKLTESEELTTSANHLTDRNNIRL